MALAGALWRRARTCGLTARTLAGAGDVRALPRVEKNGVYTRGMSSAAPDFPTLHSPARAPASVECGEMVAPAVRQSEEKVAIASVDWFQKAHDLKEHLVGALKWVDLNRDALKEELAQEFDTCGPGELRAEGAVQLPQCVEPEREPS